MNEEHTVIFKDQLQIQVQIHVFHVHEVHIIGLQVSIEHVTIVMGVLICKVEMTVNAHGVPSREIY